MKNKLKPSSKRWLERQKKDIYTKSAKNLGVRSRAYFKLKEIDEKYKIFQNSNAVVDLGAAPGAWTQYVLSKIKSSKDKVVIAVDILPIEPISGADIIQGDVTTQKTLESVRGILGNRSVDVVLSDMAPNLSGNWAVDAPRSQNLVEIALDFASVVLSENGCFVIKIFQSEYFTDFVKSLREMFEQVLIHKPKASRDESREVYIIAKKPKRRG